MPAFTKQIKSDRTARARAVQHTMGPSAQSQIRPLSSKLGQKSEASQHFGRLTRASHSPLRTTPTIIFSWVQGRPASRSIDHMDPRRGTFTIQVILPHHFYVLFRRLDSNAKLAPSQPNSRHYHLIEAINSGERLNNEKPLIAPVGKRNIMWIL